MTSADPALFAAYTQLQGEGDDDSDKDIVFNGRYCDITQICYSEYSEGESYLTDQLTTEKLLADQRFGRHSLLLRRKQYRNDPGRIQMQLEIQSPTLQAVFRRVASRLTTININANPIVINAPFHELYHIRTELAAASRDPGTPAPLRSELALFQQFEREHLLPVISNIDALVSHGCINGDSMWALFPPGELVLLQACSKAGLLEAEIRSGVLRSFTEKKSNTGEVTWHFNIVFLSFQAGRFAPVEEKHQFPYFQERTNIASLPIYPLRCCPDRAVVEEMLADRGSRYVELCRQIAHCEYHGPVWTTQYTNSFGFFDPASKILTGRVIVDNQGFIDQDCRLDFKSMARPGLADFENEIPEYFDDQKRGRGPRPVPLHLVLAEAEKQANNVGIAKESRIETGEPSFNDGLGLTRAKLMLLPSRLAGYSLVTKDKGFLLVSGLSPVCWESKRADQLRKSSTRMQSVLSVASGFSYQGNNFNYSVGGKGRGLVLLLHGPSGMGKTLTAECVAEALRKPLYRVSGSDLGFNVEQVETRLRDAFARAARWKAILLFDEADAFMSERKDETLERNALVAVLLRLLEYQSGLIILTTNRVQDFDKAFYSRIHISISYPGLTAMERTTIWRDALADVPSAPPLALSDLARLGELALDGRTIKNVVRVLELFLASHGGDTVEDEAERLPISAPRLMEEIKRALQLAATNASEEAKEQLERFRP